MATMTNDTVNNLWVLEQTATGAGTFTDLLTTENKFLDKNISIKSTIPAASNPALTITDKGSTDIGISSTATSGYYTLTASLVGKLTVGNAGWLTTDGLSATDDSVIVGRIAQSTLKNGTTAISSGATITPSVTDTQTINISAGYNTARNVKIAPMSSGTAAAAKVTVSGTATKPTLTNTSSTISGKTQVNVSGITETNSNIDSAYYVALTVDAPATTPTFTKNITTAGYLGPVGTATNTQIATEGSITHKEQLYFAELASGEISIGGNSSTVGALTISKYNTDGSANGKNVNPVAFTGSASTTEPTSGNYVAVQVQVPAVTITPTVTLTTAGWVGDVNQITKSNVTSNGSTTQIYIPLTSGALAKGAGSADASSTTITLGTKTTTQPSSGKYITVTGSGTVKVGTGGYLAKDTSLASNTATAYYPIYAITSNDFTITDNVIKSNKAGWLDNNITVATLGTGSLANSPTTGQTYEEVNSPAILTSDGYLYINKGYLGNTKISLGTLIPNSDVTDVVSGVLRIGYEAFDTAGQRIVGGLATYDGTYSVVGWTVAT